MDYDQLDNHDIEELVILLAWHVRTFSNIHPLNTEGQQMAHRAEQILKKAGEEI